MAREVHTDEGATATEYAVMIAGIAVVIFGGVTLFGQGVVGLFQTVPPGVF